MPERSSGRESSKTGSSLGCTISRFLLADGGRIGDVALRLGGHGSQSSLVGRRCQKAQDVYLSKVGGKQVTRQEM